MTEVQINNKPLSYELFGTGECLVLIHGALTDRRIWQAQCEAFASHYQVLAYDLYGYGKSEFTDEKRIEHADDLAVLLQSLNIDKAHVLGVSMGGEIALRFALEYPERIRSLILVGTGLEGFDYPEDAFGWWGNFIEALQADTFDKARDIFIQGAFNSPETPLSPDIEMQLQTIIQDYSFRHYLDDTLLWKDYGIPVIDRLNEIHCPTLLIVGQADDCTNHEIAKLLDSEITTGSLVILSNAGHLPNLQVPELFNETVLNYLNNLKD